MQYSISATAYWKNYRFHAFDEGLAGHYQTPSVTSAIREDQTWSYRLHKEGKHRLLSFAYFGLKQAANNLTELDLTSHSLIDTPHHT